MSVDRRPHAHSTPTRGPRRAFGLAPTLLGVGLVALMVGGCGVDELGEVGADGGGDGQVPEQVILAFEDSCAVPGCHEGSAPIAGLSLERGSIDSILSADSGIVDMPLVKIGDVPGSFIAVKIMEEETLALYGVERTGRRMPIGNVNDQTRQDIAIIIAWIAGAEIPPPVDGGPMGTDTGAFDDDWLDDEAWGH